MSPRARQHAAAAAMGVAYCVAASATVATTRYGGGVAFLWLANAILIARLTTIAQRRWVPILCACFVGSAIATTLFGIGAALALPLAVVNVGEAVIAAVLLRRMSGSTDPFVSLGWLFGFFLAVGVAAPFASALAGAGAVHLIAGKPFVDNAAHWFAGHALGNLAFAPISMLVLRGDVRRWRHEAVPARRVEVVLLLALILATTAAVFAQRTLPLLFVPMLPIILATFRGGRLAAAASVLILTLVGGALTVTGHGPVSMIRLGSGEQIQFFQFYLAATMLTILPVAAELERRGLLYRELRESEARYRLVTDHSSDIVLNLNEDGRIRFISPSARRYGYAPEALLGTSVISLIEPADRADAIGRHREAMRCPDETVTVRYRIVTADAALRWFESHVRAVLDERGRVSGMVSAVRDATQRKSIEERLERAAMTDALTGLANRRAFMAALDERLRDDAGGCVAMFDLDHFKRVNDRFGHAAGDRALERFAALAAGLVRGGDLVARIGGEEFALILPGLSIEAAHRLSDRLRQEVGRRPLALGGFEVAVTVSGGVAAYAPSASVEDVLRHADAALYRAKAGGRDRLAIAA